MFGRLNLIKWRFTPTSTRFQSYMNKDPKFTELRIKDNYVHRARENQSAENAGVAFVKEANVGN